MEVPETEPTTTDGNARYRPDLCVLSSERHWSNHKICGCSTASTCRRPALAAWHLIGSQKSRAFTTPGGLPSGANGFYLTHRSGCSISTTGFMFAETSTRVKSLTIAGRMESADSAMIACTFSGDRLMMRSSISRISSVSVAVLSSKIATMVPWRRTVSKSRRCGTSVWAPSRASCDKRFWCTDPAKSGGNSISRMTFRRSISANTLRGFGAPTGSDRIGAGRHCSKISHCED
jgi:hypothetical protein